MRQSTRRKRGTHRRFVLQQVNEYVLVPTARRIVQWGQAVVVNATIHLRIVLHQNFSQLHISNFGSQVQRINTMRIGLVDIELFA